MNVEIYDGSFQTVLASQTSTDIHYFIRSNCCNGMIRLNVNGNHRLT